MTALLAVAAAALWLVWWAWFAATELWLRRHGRPVAFGVSSPKARVVAFCPVLTAALALFTGETIWLWTTLILVLPPYYAVVRLATERRKSRLR